MWNIGIISFFRNLVSKTTKLSLVTQQGNNFYEWNGKIFQSDIVRACIRPKVRAIGKLVAKHVREQATRNGKTLAVNPDAHIRLLLEEPNPYMSGQKLQEKLAMQLALNNNAFALVCRDENDRPLEIYPLPANSVEALYASDGRLSLRFLFNDGKRYTFPYSDIIHLRQDFGENDLFGTSLAPVLAPLMEIVSVTDQGIIKAIKNSNVIQWLLKLTQATRPEDIKKQADLFAESFMRIDNNSVGVAATDTKIDAVQIKPYSYVPNADQMALTTMRIYSLFGTNEKIIQSKYNEDEWNAYYEAEIEPVCIDLKSEYTRKIFTRRERGVGNRITFDAANLATASMTTKLNLVQFVDRGMMTPNEVRAILNYAPLPDGDTAIRRLDTRPIWEGDEKDNED